MSNRTSAIAERRRDLMLVSGLQVDRAALVVLADEILETAIPFVNRQTFSNPWF